MELPETSQPPYSWPQDGSKCSESSSPVKVSSCDQPDLGARGDGTHNQVHVKPRKDSFFWEEIRSALNQAQAEMKNSPSKETESHSLNYLIQTVADRECSEEELRSINLFLKSCNWNIAKENTKNCDEIVMNAIKVGMFLETKRKGSLIFNKVGPDAVQGDSIGSGGSERDQNVGMQQHICFKEDTSKYIVGDKTKQSYCRSNISGNETWSKTAEPLCMTICSKCSHVEIKCQYSSETLAYDAHISSNDLSDCDPENYEHAIITKSTYPLHEERVSNELIGHQKMMHSEVALHENDNMPPGGQSQENGKGNTRPQKEIKSAVATHSSSALTYRVELQGKHSNGKMVGRMIVAEDGVANLTCSEPDFDEELIIVASTNVMRYAECNKGLPNHFRSNLIGEVFSLKVVSIASDKDIINNPDLQNMTDVTGIGNVINNIKRSASDLGNVVSVPSVCSLCLVKLTSAKHAKIHYSGKAHQRRTLLSSFGKSFGCDACNVTYTSPKHAEGHVIGRKHRNKVAFLMEPAVIGVPVEDSKNKSSIGDKPLVCRVCSITTNSLQNLIDHFNGTKHLKKLEILKEARREKNSRQDIPDECCIISNAMTGETILPLRSTLDLSTNTYGSRTKPLHGDGAVDRSKVSNKQCHSKQSTYPSMSLPFKSKFNLSNLKMVRTVGTQSTDSYREMAVTCQEKLASDYCKGNMYCADSACSSDPASEHTTD